MLCFSSLLQLVNQDDSHSPWSAITRYQISRIPTKYLKQISDGSMERTWKSFSSQAHSQLCYKLVLGHASLMPGARASCCSKALVNCYALLRGPGSQERCQRRQKRLDKRPVWLEGCAGMTEIVSKVYPGLHQYYL